MPCKVLPPEMWAMVFEQVYLTPWSRRETLRSACLVSRCWLADATPWLYRRVRIGREKGARKRGDAFDTIYGQRTLARHVHVLVLDAPWGSTYYKTEEPWVQNWTEALKLCTDLREVEIRPRMGSAYPCTILEFKRTLDYLMSGLQTLAHLKTLTLDLLPPYHSFPTYIANSARPFVQFGDLRSFSLGIVSPHERDLLRRVNESLLTAGRLGEFRLTLHLSENAGFNSSSFPECCEALKKVTSLRIAQTSTRIPIAVLLIPVNLSELTFKYSHGIFEDIRALPTLPSLRILSIEAPKNLDQRNLRSLLTVVISLTRGSQLQNLILQCTGYSCDRLASISGERFVDDLPDSLQVFRADKLPVTLGVLRRFLSKCRCLRGLAVSLRDKSDFEKFQPPVLASAGPLECLQLQSWFYGDAQDVEMSEETAVRWMEGLPTLRHVAINAAGWIASRRPELIRAHEKARRERYPVHETTQ